MAKRIFTEEEREDIKNRLLDVGFPLLQKYGVIHMSVPKITQAAGIGTGTFYRFFASKEEYILALIRYKRSRFLAEYITDDVKAGKRKLTRDELRSFVSLIADRDRSVYANMNLSDEYKLAAALPKLRPDLEHETALADGLLKYVEGVRKDIDYPVLANLMKVLAFTSQGREELHEEGYERTVGVIVDEIMRQIFGDRT